MHRQIASSLLVADVLVQSEQNRVDELNGRS